MFPLKGLPVHTTNFLPSGEMFYLFSLGLVGGGKWRQQCSRRGRESPWFSGSFPFGSYWQSRDELGLGFYQDLICTSSTRFLLLLSNFILVFLFFLPPPFQHGGISSTSMYRCNSSRDPSSSNCCGCWSCCSVCSFWCTCIFASFLGGTSCWGGSTSDFSSFLTISVHSLEPLEVWLDFYHIGNQQDNSSGLQGPVKNLLSLVKGAYFSCRVTNFSGVFLLGLLQAHSDTAGGTNAECWGGGALP